MLGHAGWALPRAMADPVNAQAFLSINHGGSIASDS